MKALDKYFYTLISIVATCLVGLFAVWWFLPWHIPHNFEGNLRFLDTLLFLLVSYVIWHPIVMNILIWSISSFIKKVKHEIPPRNLKVAFVTTFVPHAESISLLHKTLPAMVSAHYKHDTWLLDEGDDPSVQDLCKKYGVRHFSRYGNDSHNTKSGKYKVRTKGGNHNSWYATIGNEYDIVAQIDTDFIPHQDFLIETLGYFNDPKIAFVGTPQIYGNTEKSLIAAGAAQQTYNFYGPVLRGLSGMDMMLLIGANHVIRVKALRDVDHYSAHITEDLLTGMKLHSKGWKSIYIPKVLAVGEGPTTWQSFFNQQMRWGYGCMDILFRHSFRLFRGMNFRFALYYYLLQQHYFSGLAMMLGLFGLSLYFLFGINMANINYHTFFVLYIPTIVVCGIMEFWLQRFNIRPRKEKGILMLGRIVGMSAWPIYFLAFIGALFNKKLSYQVTPKGLNIRGISVWDYLRNFSAHIIIGILCFSLLFAAVTYGRNSFIMLGWLITSLTVMVLMPMALSIYSFVAFFYETYQNIIGFFHHRYQLFEYKVSKAQLLPLSVSDNEKYQFTNRHHKTFLFLSSISFIPALMTLLLFSISDPRLYFFIIYFAFTLIYLSISFLVNIFSTDFDLEEHKRVISVWKPKDAPTIDIFLPTAGEPIELLWNTWDGVTELIHHYKGSVIVYCLDDSAREEVKKLADYYNFEYIVRPNRGEFKKAGNLQHGYKISKSEFIAIFDADFRPRFDFFDELLAYFYRDKRVGIVQSPQYFDVSVKQSWLERGAGAVQEFFYRYAQVSRQKYDAAICVGSNAIYRRRALDDAGGTALIEHSEDVHTGFNVRLFGWKLQYVPIILAKGLCPSTMAAFFKQQYRWCLGSMSLLSSKKYWNSKLSFGARMSYISGFLYYLHTAFSSIIVPLIPVIALFVFRGMISMNTYLLLAPSFLFMHIAYPIWHDSIYGMEAWSTRMVYGWAHLFAVIDSVTGNAMQWNPTGSKITPDYRYVNYRILQFLLNFIPAMVWVAGCIWFIFVDSNRIRYIPMLIIGFYYLFLTMKVSFYHERKIK